MGKGKALVREIKRYVKYSIVGSGGMLVNFAVLYLLTDIISIWYIASAVLGIVAAASFNYMLNHKWAFKDVKQNNKNLKAGWLKFVIAKAVGDVLYLGVLALLTEVFGLWYMLSAGISVVVTVIPGYILVSWWVWNKKVWQLETVE